MKEVPQIMLLTGEASCHPSQLGSTVSRWELVLPVMTLVVAMLVILDVSQSSFLSLLLRRRKTRRNSGDVSARNDGT